MGYIARRCPHMPERALMGDMFRRFFDLIGLPLCLRDDHKPTGRLVPIDHLGHLEARAALRIPGGS
jgi:hypothetical protein